MTIEWQYKISNKLKHNDYKNHYMQIYVFIFSWLVWLILANFSL